MRPGAIFVGALVLFALLGLLTGRPSDSPEPRQLADTPPSTPAPHANDGPASLARRWARSFAEWTSESLSDQLAALADSATPPLASDLRRGVQAIRRDATLTRDDAGSRGTVEVVRVEGNGRRREVLVVTRETPYMRPGRDLHGARYRVYEGTAVQAGSDRWRMESWERQP